MNNSAFTLRLTRSLTFSVPASPAMLLNALRPLSTPLAASKPGVGEDEREEEVETRSLPSLLLPPGAPGKRPSLLPIPKHFSVRSAAALVRWGPGNASLAPRLAAAAEQMAGGRA